MPLIGKLGVTGMPPQPSFSPLGLERVTSDILIKPELGPMCLSSFEAFKRGWNCGSSELSCDGACDLSTHAPESYVENLPHLIVTNYSSLQNWKKCCLCDRPKQCENDCTRIIILEANENRGGAAAAPTSGAVSRASSARGSDLGTTFFCITYATLNARADKIKNQSWGAIILEFSSSIPYPHGYTISNLLELCCLQWYTVNRAFVNHKKFNTRWQDIHWEARQKALQSADSRLNLAPASSLSEIPLNRKGSPGKFYPYQGTFWSYMEPGIGMDCAVETMPACHSVLKFLSEWTPSSVNSFIRISYPVLHQGVWFLRAEPCEIDRAMLSIAAANIPSERHQELYNEYFLTTHCPLDFAQLHCIICGATTADVLLICCKAPFHRDCLINELYFDLMCPNCQVKPKFDCSAAADGLRSEADLLTELEAWLLAPNTYCIVDLENEKYRYHDWSCQLTRQIITSAIQTNLAKERCEGLKCFTARVHNDEALTSKIFHETRELSVSKQPQSSYNERETPLGEELLYIFFIARGTDCTLKPRNERERCIVITLVAGIFDLPILGKNEDTLQNIRYKLQV